MSNRMLDVLCVERACCLVCCWSCCFVGRAAFRLAWFCGAWLVEIAMNLVDRKTKS